MIIPSVRAALCSLFILIKCLSLVGVCSDSTSCMVSVFEEPELSASPLLPGPLYLKNNIDSNIYIELGQPVGVAVHQHSSALSQSKLFLLSVCFPKYGIIREDHYCARNPKRN